MDELTRNGARPHDGQPGSLGELIHAAVRRTIEVAVDEELTAALGARPYERVAVCYPTSPVTEMPSAISC
jgi:hypothetical protein